MTLRTLIAGAALTFAPMAVAGELPSGEEMSSLKVEKPRKGALKAGVKLKVLKGKVLARKGVK